MANNECVEREKVYSQNFLDVVPLWVDLMLSSAVYLCITILPWRTGRIQEFHQPARLGEAG